MKKKQPKPSELPALLRNRIRAVELIIERHRDKANAYGRMYNYHTEKAKEFEQYRYELQKPGFNSTGWRRMSKQGRVEPYLVLHNSETAGV